MVRTVSCHACKVFLALTAILGLMACNNGSVTADAIACVKMLDSGIRPIAADRSQRFLGKVDEATARCRGGENAVAQRDTPWVDWSNYWATGGPNSRKKGSEAITRLGKHIRPNGRGIDGALMDFEYQRIELIKFNLFDNYTYETYATGRNDTPGRLVKKWPEMRLSAGHPHYEDVGGDGSQLCTDELIRYRTLTGICNDIRNPLMASTGTSFGRNVPFKATYPRLGLTKLAMARHSDPVHGMRIGLYKPDPQLISRKLFTRQQVSGTCNNGHGLADFSPKADCAYQKASALNLLAVFWVQFMTHDWFSHLIEGRNRPGLVPVGCHSPEARALSCRPGDRMEAALIAENGAPETFEHNGHDYLTRAYKTTSNTVTAWWDASQIYGYNATSVKRVIHNPNDPAKLYLPHGYLPLLEDCAPECPSAPQWYGQAATAFPDNWNIGLSFFHNLFAREHNSFVDAFRQQQQRTPDADSGLRDPAHPNQVITYAKVSDETLFQVARLVVSALIAKIHTIEWTTQLLYNEPLYKSLNANWFGLFDRNEGDVSLVLRRILGSEQGFIGRMMSRAAAWLGVHGTSDAANAWYSALASGAGIVGLGNQHIEGFLWWRHDTWDITSPNDLMRGVNHFGSPFNFPEAFVSVYRLHPMLPDLLEYRELQQPNAIKLQIPVAATLRGKATQAMRSRGMANWALSMGRQRAGALVLRNHPVSLQNLPMPHLDGSTGKLDIAALDIIRDRERGVPRYNEFRRQIGLKSLSSFNDFVDQHLPADSPRRRAQKKVVNMLREIYGTHVCDASKIITHAQRGADGKFVDDCLGHPDGSVVDNIEDVDLVVGMLAEYTRPHGFAISETQFQVFILNASRRLFSDRFFTSGFRPEFYSNLGINWIMRNGLLEDCPYPLSETADGKRACYEPRKSNDHRVPVSPLKRVLIRNIPQLKDELMHVVNTFDPWARVRGQYYTLAWKPRAEARSDPAFAK